MATETLSEEGTDTSLYLKAGAAGVVFVKAPREELHEALPIAIQQLSHLPGIIVEGNSAIELCMPDIVIFSFGEPGAFKDTARPVLEMAQAVVGGTLPDELARKTGARMFGLEDWDELADFVGKAMQGAR